MLSKFIAGLPPSMPKNWSGCFPKNISLKRPQQDIENLSDIHSSEFPVNLRITKGMNVEPEEVAYKDYYEINQNCLNDLEWMSLKVM